MTVLLIRADADEQIGTGHVMRCIALAQAWCHFGGSVAFVCADLPASIAARLASEGIKQYKAVMPAGSPADAEATAALISELDAAAVIDGYHFGAEFVAQVRLAANALMVVDDFGRPEARLGDIVLNQNSFASPWMYSDMGNMPELLLGPQYALLRSEFWPWIGRHREQRDNVRRILITMGGADPNKATEQLLDVLAQSLPSDVSVIAVVGAGNPRGGELAERWADSSVDVRLAVADMVPLIAEADLAITAAGSTVWELAFFGVPMLVTSIVEHQSRLAADLAARGAVIDLGMVESLTPDVWFTSLQKLLVKRDWREAMARVGVSLVDGWGSRRVAEALRNRGKEW